jgi:NADPH-dependent curcumin reductase CurA
MPVEGDFRWETFTVPEPGDGQLLVETRYLSVDPYQRYMMDDRPRFGLSPHSVQDPMPTIPLGAAIPGGVVGRVIASNSRRFEVGDLAEGFMAWQTHNVIAADDARLLQPELPAPSAALHVLGMTGITAYIGVVKIGQVVPGETVFVSSAAGGVGSIAGQIARILGCRVVGSTGSDDKVAHCIDDLGDDAAINYRPPDAAKAIERACPHGVDVYFDNVGGEFSDSMMRTLNVFGRIVCCGTIATYNDERDSHGPHLYWPVVAKRLRVQGFLIEDHADDYHEALTALGDWLKSGQLLYREHLVHGLENAPGAFRALLGGQATGKVVVAA